MLERIIGVLKLDVATFESIEHDQDATVQAAIVVAIAAVCSGIGNSIIGGGVNGFISGLIGAFIGWVVWSGITYFVGTRLFDGQADMGEMLRVIGFAQAPQMLAIIPCVGQLIGLIWTIAAVFIAIRQGLDVDNSKAAMTMVVGVIAYLAILFVLGLVLGGGAAALGALSG